MKDCVYHNHLPLWNMVTSSVEKGSFAQGLSNVWNLRFLWWYHNYSFWNAVSCNTWKDSKTHEVTSQKTITTAMQFIYREVFTQLKFSHSKTLFFVHILVISFRDTADILHRFFFPGVLNFSLDRKFVYGPGCLQILSLITLFHHKYSSLWTA